jgi:hypothetical protein
MPARTLNDFFAGFFIGSKPAREVKMAIVFYKGQEKGGVKVVKVEGGREKEKEVMVRNGVVSPKWKRWSYDHFSRDWNKNYAV